MKSIKEKFPLILNLTSPIKEEIKTYPLESIITIINNSLDKANEELTGEDPKIEKTKITLKTVYDKSGGGGFKLFVKASKKWELEKASSVTFEYKKVDKKMKISEEKIFEKNLTNAIVSAANQWKKAQEITGLSKSNFIVDLSFVVINTIDGGVEFEIWDAGINLFGKYRKTAVHSVSLTFE